MGTLTADCPRLDSHCPHKLATSCRLTSTPNCCACADERPHSRLYRVYIDGVGFVQRGTRWKSYCWFCKEFWNNRLAATDPPLEPSQTQIPLIPDQTEFLERWFEFHQGYRIVKHSDGTESRVAVLGEPLKDVSPGFLPRTLHQLRRRVENDASRPENRFRRRRLSSEEERPEEPQQTIEDALDNLLAEISDDEETPDPEEQAADMPREAAGLSRPLTRAEIRLQRARDRFVRVFGSREDVQRDDYESPISQMYNRAMTRYRQAEERRASGETAAPPLGGMSDQERRDIEEQLLWGVLNESRTSLREPLREHQTGNVRSYTPAPLDRSREDSATDSATDSSSGGPFVLDSSTTFSRSTEIARSPAQARFDGELRQTLASLSQQLSEPPPPSSSSPPLPPQAGDLITPLRHPTTDVDRLQRLQRLTSEAVSNAHANLHYNGRAPRPPSPGPAQTLDTPDRPPPLSEEAMTKTLACQVCYSQLADIAVLPCGHMVMCQWCADIVVPVRHSHLPARPSKCPMCRKGVKQRFKIHVGG